jgi:MYND finger
MASKYVKKSPEKPVKTPVNRPTRQFKFTPVAKENPTVNSTPLLPKASATPSVNIKTQKSSLKPELSLEQFYKDPSTKVQAYNSSLAQKTSLNECALCDKAIFDTATGTSDAAVADLSPNTCFHIFHAKCLKQSTKSFGNACPLCDSPLAMWVTARQAAHFPGFWQHRVEQYLLQHGPPQDLVTEELVCLPVSEIREAFSKDATLTVAQKVFIHDDPSGMGKGLQAALEWGGYRDYNKVPKGHVGFHNCLRTKGMWKYDSKKDDIWLWSWGDIHPRQRCDQCQMIKRPLPVVCQQCVGSSEAAYYCSSACSKRDWQRHKQVCQQWKDHGPADTK